MPKHEQEERLNPKMVLRRIMELMPDTFESHIRETIVALYAHSNGALKASDLDAGTVKFSGSFSNSQIGVVCGIETIRGIQRRMKELRKLGLLKTKLMPNRQHGNKFEVTYSTPSRSIRRDPAKPKVDQDTCEHEWSDNPNITCCLKCGKEDDRCHHCHEGHFVKVQGEDGEVDKCDKCGLGPFEFIDD
jgi:hypothetical protein